MRIVRWVAIIGILGAFSHSAFARNMHGRVGLGYNSQFSNSAATNGVSALSLKYGLTRDVAAALVVGATTAAPSNLVAGLKLFKNVFYETNLNFYIMLAAAMISANGNFGADFQGGFGTEFFIPGIESLGFSVELGASFNNASGGFVLKTMGASFLQAGIHFYF